MPNCRVCSSMNALPICSNSGIVRVDEEGAGKLAPTGQLLKFRLGELLLQRRRHVTGEPLQHGRHAQFSLPGDDLLLKFQVAVDPTLRQRAAPTVDAPHPTERQIARPDEELARSARPSAPSVR